jgi:Arc/MetJ-type ribon-helix-helix transcriptional regulator
MPRLTVTITDEQDELLNEITGDDGEYESKSAAVRSFIQIGERMDELEQENDRLRKEKRLIIEEQKEHSELVEYVEREKSLQERREAREERQEARRNAPIWKRGYWMIFGKGDQDALASE